MTVIRPNSISGITSITTLQNSIEFYKSDGSAGANIDNISINTAGIITANTFYGDGSNLTGITGTTINNNAANRVITGEGGTTLNGEANLTFDGDSLLLLSSTDGRRVSFAGGGTSHYMKFDNTLNGIILNGYGGITFETNGTNERVRIDSAGRIGIGENNPTRDIVIKKSGSVQVSMVGATNQNVFLNFGDTDDDNIGGVYYDNTNNRMIIRANTNDAVQVKSNGNMAINDGDLEIGTSGHGISFAATANSTATGVSMSHEVFDDYEEGNWTPFFYAWIGGGVPATHDVQYGKYTKIGRVVHIVFDLKGDRGNMGGSYITVGGLPFAHLGSNAEFSSIPWTEYVGGENSTSSTRGHGLEFGGGATVHAWLTGYTSGAGGSGYTATYMSTSYMSNTNHTRIRGSATYLTDA